MTKEDKDKDIEDYLYKVYGNINNWYNVADTKATSIISIVSFLLGFVSLGVFLENNTQDLENNTQDLSAFINIRYYLLIGFFITTIFSIGLAIIGLWARLQFNFKLFKRIFDSKLFKRIFDSKLFKRIFDSIYKQKKPLDQQYDNLPIFFKDISNKYPVNENEMKKARENFLNDVERCYNKENLKVRLSEEIVVLSENTTKKFVYVDIAYSFLLASITLLSLFIALKNF